MIKRGSCKGIITRRHNISLSRYSVVVSGSFSFSRRRYPERIPSSSGGVSCRTRKTRLCTVNVRSHRHVAWVFAFRFNRQAKNYRLIAPFSKIHDTPTDSLFPLPSADPSLFLFSFVSREPIVSRGSFEIHGGRGAFCHWSWPSRSYTY